MFKVIIMYYKYYKQVNHLILEATCILSESLTMGTSCLWVFGIKKFENTCLTLQLLLEFELYYVVKM